MFSIYYDEELESPHGGMFTTYIMNWNRQVIWRVLTMYAHGQQQQQQHHNLCRVSVKYACVCVCVHGMQSTSPGMHQDTVDNPSHIASSLSVFCGALIGPRPACLSRRATSLQNDPASKNSVYIYIYIYIYR